ncbi:hypothetical protein [Exiguobacterium flavidum]|uniref:hypothetical protein n=1 Tax=Exiguobacterium flavidum TaxID=2184695 RepID=UPI000DF7D187|nr:hypothetical protein [Exiguobacterium flavidum]
MNKRLKAVSILMAAGLLAACGNEEAAPKKTAKTETAAAKTEQATEATLALELETFSTIKAELDRAKEGKTVDWKKVQSLYEEKMQKNVGQTAPEIEQVISSAIAGIQSQELDAGVARQLIDKGMQSYFYKLQKSTQNTAEEAVKAGNKDEAEKALEDISSMATTVFIPTAEKRDASYGFKNEESIAQAINSGLDAEKSAIAADSAADFGVAKQLTDKSIYRTFYLAALGYSQKVEDGVKAKADQAELQMEQAEGYGFLLAIEESLAGGDEAATARLKEIYDISKTKPEDVKYAEVESLFAKALTAKINGYHTEAQAALDKKEVDTARVEAMEANMFLIALKPTLTGKLGEAETKKLLAEANTWYAQIEKEDEAAKTTSAQIVETLKSLN